MLVTNKEVLIEADKKGYAVGAFNIYNMETLQAVIESATELKSPAIIATTESAINYAGLDYLTSMVLKIAKKSKIPIALHLDHGKNFSIIKNCIKAGYTSVMFDGSSFSFEKNIALTKKIVNLAKNKVSVEAELGQLGGKEDYVKGKIKMTDPEKAAEFVKKTKVDALAVAIGTSHGAYKFKGKIKLDFKRLKEIKDLVKIPLVLHGASGVPKYVVEKGKKYGMHLEEAKGVDDKSIKKAIKLGIRKINIDTDLRLAFTASLRETLAKNKSEFDPRKILAPAKNSIKEIVKEKIILFNSKNKA